MLQLNQISKHYGTRTLFEEITLQIHPKTRLGLIGRNGCGKSTILKLLTGDVEPDKGTMSRTPGLRVSYLSQDPRVTQENTLEAEMRTAFPEIMALQAEEERLLGRLGELDEAAQGDALNRLDDIHRELDRLDAGSVDARIGKTLRGLGFSQSELSRKVSEFSGGWQMRINLAKLLLEPTDVFLLDEPTNHLDLDACEWLEAFLRDYPGAVVAVSHDRRFLDQLTTETAEVELGRLTLRAGNYTQSMEKKEAEMLQLEAAYGRQQDVIEKQTAFIERFRASATRSTQAKSREKQLAAMERIELPQQDTRRMKVSFQPPQASGRQVLTLRNLRKSFENKTLFEKLDADLQRNQRIFLLGPNGCGKTTLFRLILGLLPPSEGEVRPGHQVSLGYFAQNQLDTLDVAKTVYDTMAHACPGYADWELRGLLARFLFSGDDAFKPVSVLSGGEKSKLALAKLMAEGPNTLLLDEPTNHMDIGAKEVLEEAFLEYSGTMLCISHDRYFIQKLATHIWEIYEGQLLVYAGNYDYYLSKRDEMRATVEKPSQPGSSSATASDSHIPTSSGEKQTGRKLSPLQARKELDKQLNKVEKAILKLEEEMAKLSAEMASPEIQQDYARLQQLNEAITPKQAELDSLNTEWEAVATAISELES